MQWDDLRFVLAVARHRTLASAGEALSVAHTTVGRRLGALEKQLGVRLFDRTPEGLIPTAAGEDLTQVAEQVEGEILAAEGRVVGRDAQLKGRLRVSMVDVLFTSFDTAFLSFVERYPGIDLTVAISRETVSLTRREADVVLRLSSAPPETLVGRRIGHLQFGVYAASSLVEKVGVDRPLQAFPWIGWDGGPNASWFDGWLADNAPGATIVLRIDDRGMLMAHAIRSGVGVQILPCVLADAYPDLERIAPLDPIFRLDVWLLTLPELRGNSRIRAFMEHMGEAISANRAALAGTGPSE